MASGQRGSFHLFRFAGIDVFLHWSWFLVAIYEINIRAGDYSSMAWNVLEYLALFMIVLLHEYGHALACRQVGGRANRIMLWPLGGVAYVLPPQRPGAVLWTIAAGPLVNAVLVGILYAAGAANVATGGARWMPDAHRFLVALVAINALLLAFNLLPIYPLDGGQILRALLWYPLGRVRSLTVATIVGFAGGAGLVLFAIATESAWMGVIAAFMLISCWQGLRQALALTRTLKAARRPGFACPNCKTAPPAGPFWVCGQCRQPFDTFQSEAVCPHCSNRYATTLCIHCGQLRPMSEWAVPGFAPQPRPAT